MKRIIIKDGINIKEYLFDKKTINYKGIKIYHNDGYYISLDNDLYFDDKEKVKLLENKIYIIKDDKTFYEINIYVYEYYEIKYCLYQNVNFIAAKHFKADIILKDNYLKDYYLFFKKGHLKTNFNDLLLNDKLYRNEKLHNGDRIKMLSFDFYYYQDFLYINDSLIINNIKEYCAKEIKINYDHKYKLFINNLPKINIPEFIIDDIKEYKIIPKEKNNTYQQLLSSFVLSISMFIIALLNIKNNQNISLIYLLMPIAMFISSFLIPIIIMIIKNYKFKRITKNDKDTYISYLNEYHKNLKLKIKKYEELLNKKYYDYQETTNSIFQIKKNMPSYLLLNIGFYSKDVILNYSYTDDVEINKILNAIKQDAMITNYPLNIDLKDNKRISIVVNNKNKELLFHKIFLSFCIKHHYEDVLIAVYALNDNFSQYFYNTPHLFFDNKRNCLNSIKDLQELDQGKYDKPLILFLYDKCDYVIENNNIIIISFVDRTNDVLKNSDIVIIYRQKDACLLNNKEIIFNYYLEDLDYQKYYALLGRYNKIYQKEKNFSFKDIYQVEDLRNNYLSSHQGLEALFSVTNGDILSFDIHENKCGSHGLIGGATGSGKSELLISFILSMAIKYPPDYLNFIIIDYKGGGICESLSYDKIRIPHIVGEISNLEKVLFERMIYAIKNECHKREILFKELSIKTQKAIFDIDSYLKEASVNLFPKMAHLVIIVDEFAELKREHGEYIKELISLSRIGRSLGIHLILTTQKPAGNIDEEIWSNSRFKIALKVFDAKDSMDLIKQKDAAYLKKPGEFYLLVDDMLKKAKCIYSKNDYYQNDAYKIALLNNMLVPLKTINDKKEKTITELSIYTKEIIRLTKELNIKKEELMFYPLKAIEDNDYIIDDYFVLGRKDDYIKQDYTILKTAIKNNILIYTTRTKEINYYLNTLATNKREIILLSDNIYQNKYLRDCLKYQNENDINYLFKLLFKERKDNTTLIIDDINKFNTYFEDGNDKIIKLINLKRNEDFNIIIFSYLSNISYKLLSYFDEKYCIEIRDKNDILNIFGTYSKYQGSSYYFKEEVLNYIPMNISKFNNEKKILTSLIPAIPNIIKKKIIDNQYLLGYDLNSRKEILISKDTNILITSLNNALLSLYKEYPFNIKHYDDLDMRYYDGDILWLGKGLRKQKIFLNEINYKLNDDEGYLRLNDQHYILKIINYE